MSFGKIESDYADKEDNLQDYQKTFYKKIRKKHKKSNGKYYA